MPHAPKMSVPDATGDIREDFSSKLEASSRRVRWRCHLFRHQVAGDILIRCSVCPLHDSLPNGHATANRSGPGAECSQFSTNVVAASRIAPKWCAHSRAGYLMISTIIKDRACSESPGLSNGYQVANHQ
jgi:hypothetical protein